MPLTEAEIRRFTDERSFARGQAYYRRGAILLPRHWENQLYALCQGSAPEPYQVQIELDDAGHIVDYECTCPRGGFCKHVVALALTWIHRPHEFRRLPPLKQALAHHQREDLLKLIRRMIARHPDLLLLIEEETLAPGTTPRPTTPDEVLETAKEHLRYGLQAPDPRVLEGTLERLFRLAEGQAKRENYALAGELYALLIREFTREASPDWVYDEERMALVFPALSDATEALRLLLESHAEKVPSPQRRTWFETLFQLWLYDLRRGGYGLGNEAELALLHAPEDIWAWVEEQVRQHLPAASSWEREHLVRLLAQRREVEGRPEAAAEILLALGTPTQQAFTLLQLGRLQEARRVAVEHFGRYPGLAERFAQALVQAGHPEEALAFWRAMAAQREAYRPNLAEALEAQGHLEEALAIWKDLLAQKPSLKTYRHLKRVAQKLGRWDQERPPLDQVLTWPADTALAVLLEDGETEAALRFFWQQVQQPPPSSRNFWALHREKWAQRLAEAVEAKAPEEALALYRALAEWAIGRRGRENYRVAVGHLKKVRALYQRLGREDQWQAYLTQLRETHRRLPALQDELTRAGF